MALRGMRKNNNGKTIVFLAMALSQPRCIKRVTSLNDYGFKCVVCGYDRGKYDVNAYPHDVEVTNIGLLKDNEYWRKARKVFRDIISIRKKYRSNNVVFYAFGIFQALYLRILGERYVYEISDILYAYPKFRRFIGVLKAVDKMIIRGSIATVMTSGGFYSFYDIRSPKVFVIPNKVSPLLTRPVSPSKTTKDLSFGFVGSLRYQTILDFAEVVGQSFPNYSFHFWGGTSKEGRELIDSLTRKYCNIHFHGPFRNPEDLPKVYDTFNITVACYQLVSLNERLAEPNKLYEALFYSKPIVVSEGIYLSERVKELECGYCIDAGSKEKIFQFIDSLSADSIRRISNHESKLDTAIMVNDQNALNDYILRVIGK